MAANATSANVGALQTIDLPTNRRRFMTGAAGLSAFAIAAPIAAAAISPAPDRAAWDAAMSDYLRAKHLSDAYDVEFDRIHAGWSSTNPGMGMIKWGGEFPFQDKSDLVRNLDLEADYQQFIDGEGKWWRGNSNKMKAERRATLDSIAAFRKAKADNDARWDIEASADRHDELAVFEGDAAWSLIALPAPDAAALEWNLEYLNGFNACDPSCGTGGHRDMGKAGIASANGVRLSERSVDTYKPAVLANAYNQFSGDLRNVGS